MERGLLFNAIAVKRESEGWVVSVPKRGGGAIEYVYRTRQKARYMAAVFKLGPTWMPTPTRVLEPVRPVFAETAASQSAHAAGW